MESNKLELVIITGMSGAGKSTAANALEDIGFYCIDNIPPMLINSIIDISLRNNVNMSKIAVITDLRGYDMFDEIDSTIEAIEKRGIDPKIVFLDASNDELIKRYKENRRLHPLCAKLNLSVADAIEHERLMLKKVYSISEFIIDTTNCSSRQLRKRITDVFVDSNKNDTINVQCMSFGFKHSAPHDADLMFDVRCLPNPFYIDELRELTGLDTDVSSYVLGFEEAREIYKKIKEFVDYTLPLYEKEGKSQLVVAIGCTGGKHRSVTIVEKLFAHLKQKGLNVVCSHRDIEKL